MATKVEVPESAGELARIPRITQDKINGLIEAGLTSLELIATSKPEDLEKAGFAAMGASSAIAFARDQTGIGGFSSGLESEVRRQKKLRYLTTGSAALDKLFISDKSAEAGVRGGLEAGSIIEFYGEFASTKSQLAHQLAVNVQLPVEKGGFGQKAIVIDSENTWRPSRIRDMAEKLGLDGDEVLRNILVCEAHNTDLQVDAVKRAIKLGQENNVGAVIVDSLTGHFRMEWSGRGELADRQQNLMAHMADLEALGRALNCVVFVTNQVMKDPSTFTGMDPTKSVGGDVVNHTSKFRVYLKKPLGRKSDLGIRIARMVDAPDLPVREAMFQVDGGGVRDLDD